VAPSGEQTAQAAAVLAAAPQFDPTVKKSISVPAHLSGRPPFCPTCPGDTLLYPIDQNPAGDVLLECLSNGYFTVFRVAKQVFEPRPNHEQNWVPPLFEAPSVTRKKAEKQSKPPAASRTRARSPEKSPSTRRGRSSSKKLPTVLGTVPEGAPKRMRPKPMKKAE
jgi:hypothetical protein